jgi:hypothetical protein
MPFRVRKPQICSDCCKTFVASPASSGLVPKTILEDFVSDYLYCIANL